MSENITRTREKSIRQKTYRRPINSVIRFMNRHIAQFIFIGLPLLGMIVGIFIGMKIENYTSATKMNDYGREVRYVSYEIKSGDSLWSIASDLIVLNPEYNDIRQYIYDIKEMNKLYDDDIHSGHHILIPYYTGKNGINANAIYSKYGIDQ